MDTSGFTLTSIAFPVSPVELDGFTIQAFQWVTLSPPPPPQPHGRRFSVWAVGSDAFSTVGRGSGTFSIVADNGRGPS